MKTLHLKLVCLCTVASLLLAVSLPDPALAEPYEFDFYQGPQSHMVAVNSIVQMTSHLTNTGDTPDTYSLVATADQPGNWTLNVCYDGVCYPSSQTEFTIPAEGSLAPGATVDFSFDVTSLFDEGTGSYTISLVSDNDGSVAGTWYYDVATPTEDYALLLSPDQGVIGTAINSFVAFHPVLYNAGLMEDSYTLTMIRNQPENWSTTFCYDGICYPPFLESNRIPAAEGTTVVSGGPVVIDIDFTTLFDEGTGVVTLQIQSNTHPELIAFVSFTVTTGSVVAVNDVPATLLSGVHAAPNPFNPKTDIRFTVGGSANRDVLVDIYDAGGRRVWTLLANDVAPGPQSVAWDGRSDHGLSVAAGVYLASVRAGTERQTVKMSLVK